MPPERVSGAVLTGRASPEVCPNRIMIGIVETRMTIRGAPHVMSRHLAGDRNGQVSHCVSVDVSAHMTASQELRLVDKRVANGLELLQAEEVNRGGRKR